MRPEQAKEEECIPAAELCRESLYDFVKHAWPILFPRHEFLDSWFAGCICEHLQALTRLEIRKLLINCPPRHGKSSLVSVFWMPWAWLQDPTSQWLFASYDLSLCERDSMRSRDIVRSRWYQETFDYPFAMRMDTDATGHF